MIRSFVLLVALLIGPGVLAWNAIAYAAAQRDGLAYDRDIACVLGADPDPASPCRQVQLAPTSRDGLRLTLSDGADGLTYMTTLAGARADTVISNASLPGGVHVLLYRDQPVLVGGQGVVTETRDNPDWLRHHLWARLWVLGLITVVEILIGSLFVLIDPLSTRSPQIAQYENRAPRFSNSSSVGILR